MILPLEKQVVSLELAKRLKELGAPQDSLYCHMQSMGRLKDGVLSSVDAHCIRSMTVGTKGEGELFAAYTVAELGELLPYAVKKEGELYFIHQTPCVGGHNYDSERFCFEFTYTSIKGEAITLPIQEKTEADARAKMLIYLLKQKLISL